MIVIGDSLGDPKMADNLSEPPESIIRIGFLNHSVSLYASFMFVPPKIVSIF